MEVMPRNADATKARLLDAATAEFAAYGIAGARVDRIATAARANKNLIYIYFGSKDQLFDAVLDTHLRRLHEAVPFTPDDLPSYATRMFDFTLAHPELMRLAAWFALERGPDAALLPKVAAAYQTKLQAITTAQQAGSLNAAFAPPALLTLVLAISTAWTVANPIGVPLDETGADQLAAYRRVVAEAVRVLAHPTPAPTVDQPRGPPPSPAGPGAGAGRTRPRRTATPSAPAG